MPRLLRLTIISLAAGLAITLATSTAIGLRLFPRGSATTRVTFDWDHPYGSAGWLMTIDRTGAGWTHRARSLVVPHSYGISSSAGGANIVLELGPPRRPSPPFPVLLAPGAAAADLQPEVAAALSGNPPGGTLLNWPFQMRTGWPFRAMSYWHDGVTGWGQYGGIAFTSQRTGVTRGYVVAPSTPATALFSERVMPFQPLWPGLIGNTLLWGGLVFGLLFAPPLIRTTRRRRRGHCIHCNYNLAGLAVCPECGRAADAREPHLEWRSRSGVTPICGHPSTAASAQSPQPAPPQ